MSLARLIGALEEIRVPEGTRIVKEGAEADALYLVEVGRISLSVNSPDGEVELAQIEGPGYFGELGILLSRRTATARALGDARLWRLPRRRFEELVREGPEIALAVATTLAELTDRRQRHLVGAPLAPVDRAAPRPVRRAGGRAQATRLAGAIAALGIPLLFWQTAPPAGLEVAGWRVLLLLLGAAIAWLSEPIPDFAVAIALAAAWGLAGLAPLGVALSGFATSSWALALGALALAAAMASSGLLFRVALLLLRAFPATHAGQVVALVVSGALLTPLVPMSVARVAAISRVTAELAQSFGYAPRSRGSAALAFAGLVGYWYFSSIFLTGLATNFFVLELIPPAERGRFDWLGWLTGAAVVGLVCLVGATAALFALFPPERQARIAPETLRRQEEVLGPLSRAEITSLVALAVLIVGLVGQPLLRVEPAWVALGTLAIVAAGVLDRASFRSSIDWGFLVFFAILIGSAEVLRTTGLDRWVADELLALSAAAGSPSVVVIGLAVVVMASRIVLPSRPAWLLLSLAVVPAAPALGLSPWVAGVVVLLAANVWVFPYQGLEYLVLRDATRGEAFTDRQGMAMGAALAAIRLVAIAASVPYWRALGLVG